MARKNLPSYYTEEDRQLIKLFKEEMDRINLLYMKAVNSYDLRKANDLLKRMKRISKTLNDKYWERADIKIPTEYIKWAKYIDNNNWIDDFFSLWKSEIKTILWELWPIHIEAVNALLNNSKNYVRSSLDWMERQAISMVNELQQEQIREQLAKSVISWESGFNMNKRVAQYFMDNWITGFKDKWWKYWSMDRYVDMLTRTETSIANVQWTINRAIQLWITKFKIVERPDCCKECYHQHWWIVDVSKWVVELPPFHPNCRWYIVSVIGNDDSKYRWQELWLPNVEMYNYLKKDIDKVRMKTEHPIWIVDESIIRNYSWRSYEQLNQWTPKWIADRLDKIILKNADYNWTVYRWMAFTSNEWEEFLKDGEIYHPWFMSTSVEEKNAQTFAWLNNHISPEKEIKVIIKLQDTSWGMDIQNYAKKENQHEVLFWRQKTIILDLETQKKKRGYIYINGYLW